MWYIVTVCGFGDVREGLITVEAFGDIHSQEIAILIIIF